MYQDFGTYVTLNSDTLGRYPSKPREQPGRSGLEEFFVRERVRIQYRFEAYNVFNHVRFGAPNADPTSSNFGKVNPTEQNNLRLVQMALKLSF